MYKTLLSAAAVLLATILISAPTPAEAAIYKCIDAGGGISYSSAPCPKADTTGAVLKNKRDNDDYVDCRIANLFTLYTAAKMKEGTSREQSYEEYGGIATLTRTTSSIINFVYSFSYNESVVPARIARHSAQRCQSHAFGNPTCDQFPDLFIKEAGGCEAAKTSTVKTIDNKEKQSSPSSNRSAAMGDPTARSNYKTSYTPEPVPSYEREEEPDNYQDFEVASNTQSSAPNSSRTTEEEVEDVSAKKECQRGHQAEMRLVRKKLREKITAEEQKRLLAEYKSIRAEKNAC